jgi:hypothetical protein
MLRGEPTQGDADPAPKLGGAPVDTTALYTLSTPDLDLR